MILTKDACCMEGGVRMAGSKTVPPDALRKERLVDGICDRPSHTCIVAFPRKTAPWDVNPSPIPWPATTYYTTSCLQKFPQACHGNLICYFCSPPRKKIVPLRRHSTVTVVRWYDTRFLKFNALVLKKTFRKLCYHYQRSNLMDSYRVKPTITLWLHREL